MSGAPLFPSLILGIWTVQAPVDPQPVAPPGPAPEAGMAPAEVESTPALQRPSAEPEPAPAASPTPDAEPAVAPEPIPEMGSTPAEPAPDPGVGTTQQAPIDDPSRGQSSSGPKLRAERSAAGRRGGGRKGKKDGRKKGKKGGSLYNPLWLGVGLGLSFIGGGRGAFNVGADATYFFLPWLGAGADIGNTFFFGVDEDQVSNIFTFTPTATILMAPRSRLSPYVRGGVGPIVYNRGGGTLGTVGLPAAASCLASTACSSTSVSTSRRSSPTSATKS